MQEAWVQFLVQEDPTHHAAAKLMSHNYWACALEPRSRNYWSRRATVIKSKCRRDCAPQKEKPLQWEAHSLQLEGSPCSPQLDKSLHSNEDPAQPKANKLITIIFFKSHQWLLESFSQHISLKLVLPLPLLRRNLGTHPHKQGPGIGMWTYLGWGEGMILPTILWKVYRNLRIKGKMPLSTKLWEKKGRSSPHCLKLPMLLPRKAACSQQPSTVHSRALRLCHQQKENILSSSCLSAVACPLTTCGQGKLSTFISCSKLESPIWIYQMTANSFTLSFQDHCPTFDPFWQLTACRIPAQWGMTLWGKPVLLKGIAETFWDASTMATIVITSFCCERQPSKEDKEMDYPQNTKLGLFVSWGWCGQAADRTLVVLESTWEVWNRQWEKYTKSTN